MRKKTKLVQKSAIPVKSPKQNDYSENEKMAIKLLFLMYPQADSIMTLEAKMSDVQDRLNEMEESIKKLSASIKKLSASSKKAKKLSSVQTFASYKEFSSFTKFINF